MSVLDPAVLDLLKLLLAGSAGAFLREVVAALKARSEAKRAGVQQSIDAAQTVARSAATVAETAANVAALQDDEVVESKQEIRALQSEVTALRTLFNQEHENRLKSEAMTAILERQIAELRQTLADVKATAIAGQEALRDSRREADALKGALYNMALGVARLTAQLHAAQIEPAYAIGVPFDPGAAPPSGDDKHE